MLTGALGTAMVGAVACEVQTSRSHGSGGNDGTWGSGGAGSSSGPTTSASGGGGGLLSCAQILQCRAQCGTSSCNDQCVKDGTAASQVQLATLDACVTSYGCGDVNSCLPCTAELDACINGNSTGAGSGSGGAGGAGGGSGGDCYSCSARVSGNGPMCPGSATLFNALQACGCAQCANECPYMCSDGFILSDPCFACMDGSCPAEMTNCLNDPANNP